MHFRTVAVLFAGFTAAAQEMPKFELDVSKWRTGAQKVQQMRQLVVTPPSARCAIRLREMLPLAEGKIQIVRPGKGKQFAVSEAKLPAEACAAH